MEGYPWRCVFIYPANITQCTSIIDYNANVRRDRVSVCVGYMVWNAQCVSGRQNRVARWYQS